MESVNVVVTTSIGEECVRQIMATSPRIKLWDVSDWTRAEQNGDFTSKKQFDVYVVSKNGTVSRSRFTDTIGACPRPLKTAKYRLKKGASLN